MSEEEEEVGNKVVLLGEAGVGKTSIISRYIKQKFDPEYITSLTSQFLRKIVEFPDNKKITLDIFDTSGQEKYRSVAKFYYRNSRAVILVYDITSTKSFKEMKEYWYEQIKEVDIENFIIAIVANKNDLYEEREVQDEEGEKFAQQIGGFFVSTSAKNDSGVNDLFDNIAKKILDPNYVYSIEEDKNLDINKEKDKNDKFIEEFEEIENEEENEESEGKESIKSNKSEENEKKSEKSGNSIKKNQSFRISTKTVKESEAKVKKRKCCK